MLNLEKIEMWAPLLVFALMILVAGCGSSQGEAPERTKILPENIRRAVVANRFYPGNPTKLREMVTGFFENVKKSTQYPNIIGLVSPHAGLVYSGQTAAYAYKQVAGQEYDAVIILAPSHYEAIEGASIWNKGAYETPLGVIPIHEEIANKIIAQEKSIHFTMAGHRQEHSLEVQLPFLQVAIPNLKIVPIVVQDYSFRNCNRIAAAIANATKGKKVLLVASTDLYHGESYNECVKSSESTLASIEALEPEELFDSFQEGSSQACGAGPVVIVEMAARQLGANKAKLLYKTNSNDVTGEKGGYVVGYGAVVIYKNKNQKKQDKEVGVDMGLSLEEKRQLIQIAKTSVEHAVKGENIPEFEINSEILQEKRGAFVTLNKHGRLRGCIGYIRAYKPLYQAVSEMAQAAALQDPRFPKVKPSELNDLHFDISVLTPIREISDINEIEVGKHGIIIEQGRYSGLLLPQVATENNWDRTTFLEHTCTKAGLPTNAWQEEATKIKIFSADVFSQDDVE